MIKKIKTFKEVIDPKKDEYIVIKTVEFHQGKKKDDEYTPIQTIEFHQGNKDKK